MDRGSTCLARIIYASPIDGVSAVVDAVSPDFWSMDVGVAERCEKVRYIRSLQDSQVWMICAVGSTIGAFHHRAGEEKHRLRGSTGQDLPANSWGFCCSVIAQGFGHCVWSVLGAWHCFVMISV